MTKPSKLTTAGNEPGLAFTSKSINGEVNGQPRSDYMRCYLCADRLIEGRAVIDAARREGYSCRLRARRAASILYVATDADGAAEAEPRAGSDRRRFLFGSYARLAAADASIVVAVHPDILTQVTVEPDTAELRRLRAKRRHLDQGS